MSNGWFTQPTIERNTNGMPVQANVKKIVGDIEIQTGVQYKRKNYHVNGTARREIFIQVIRNMTPGDSIVLTNRESANFTKVASEQRILMKTSVLDGQENKAKPDKLVRIWHMGARTDFTIKPRKKRTT